MKHNNLPLKRKFLTAVEIGLEFSFVHLRKNRTCWSMTVTNSSKEVSLHQIHLSTDYQLELTIY